MQWISSLPPSSKPPATHTLLWGACWRPNILSRLPRPPLHLPNLYNTRMKVTLLASKRHSALLRARASTQVASPCTPASPAEHHQPLPACPGRGHSSCTSVTRGWEGEFYTERGKGSEKTTGGTRRSHSERSEQ